ncbi:MAG: hypothetical protein U5L96_19420 [Owenweeksia sp.]|nr:hypothetical protein [Owenweeksia sp.]
MPPWAWRATLQNGQLKPEYTQKSASAGTNWLAIAATVVLLLSLGINVLQYRNMQNVENEAAEYGEMRLASLELENESMVANYREMEENLAMLRDPATATFL